jgi:hypothetical protein
MYALFKDTFLLMMLDAFIQCNEYITNIPDDYYDQMGLLYKTDVYLIFEIMYEESSYMWMSLGFRPSINSKTAKKVLGYVNLLPDDVISHIAAYIPEVNYTLAKKCNNCNKYHREIKQYSYVQFGPGLYNAQGVDSQFVYCTFQVANNIDAIRQIYESGVIYGDDDNILLEYEESLTPMRITNRHDGYYFNAIRAYNDFNDISRNILARVLSERNHNSTRPIRNTRTQNRFEPYPEPPNDEAVNFSLIRAFTGDVELQPRRLFGLPDYCYSL